MDMLRGYRHNSTKCVARTRAKARTIARSGRETDAAVAKKLSTDGAGTAAFPFAAALARAEDYPTRPVRLIVGFPAGSGPDIVARIIAQGMSDRLGQSVIVENRPGAGSNLATSDVAHAVPDGYMLMPLTTANVINATLYQNLNYDLMRDIASSQRELHISF
jgi:tripartite-type tricarboxylate transporter receptor subunit TctC